MSTPDTNATASLALGRNPSEIEPARIPLFTGEDCVGHALVDHEDYAELSRFCWRLHAHGYAVRTNGRGRWLYMHREILGLRKGDATHVDHINRNPLDNRRSNLRPCSHAENMQNLATHTERGVSRYRGVSLDRRSGLWRARVQLHLGSFASQEDAAAAVIAWRAEHAPFAAEDRRLTAARGRAEAIVELWEQGLTARQIAEQLGLSSMWAVHAVIKRLRRSGIAVSHREAA